MDYMLEVIAYNIDCCIAIEKAGAERIELCSNLAEGGTTPSYGLIKHARTLVTTELFPMIRPRGGDFVYSPLEFEVMKTDIMFCRDAGCDGIVTGILTPDGKVDKEKMKILAELASPLGITFHRAFDRSADPFQALEDIIECGCERILTSGQNSNASAGSEMIRQLVEKSGDRIIIMPGGGVRSNNLEILMQQTGAEAFHTSALRARIDPGNAMIDENELALMMEIIRKNNG